MVFVTPTDVELASVSELLQNLDIYWLLKADFKAEALPWPITPGFDPEGPEDSFDVR